MAKRTVMMAGEKFNRLTALEFIESRGTKSKTPYWKFRCDCGAVTISRAKHVRQGRTQSCGCLLNEQIKARSVTHGMSGTIEHRSWKAMLARCCNKNVPEYIDYGGRGIKVCERWKNFKNFFDDMGFRTSPSHSLDRIDNDGNYEPGNCRWATAKEQSNNRRPYRKRAA